MSKIEIKDLYLIFGNEKQKALKMLKKDTLPWTAEPGSGRQMPRS